MVVADGDGAGCVVVLNGECVLGVHVLCPPWGGCWFDGCVVPPEFLVPRAILCFIMLRTGLLR